MNHKYVTVNEFVDGTACQLSVYFGQTNVRRVVANSNGIIGAQFPSRVTNESNKKTLTELKR